MPSDDQKALREIFEEMLTEYEIFVNNSEQLIKDAKAILGKQKRSKK